MLISPEYREQQRQMHRDHPDYGTTGGHNVDLVRKVSSWGRKRILDYGCGKQKMAEALGPAYRVTGYDPAIEGMDEEPQPHPVVVCSDVLEHVEPECVEDVLRDIRRCTQQTALLLIATGPAEKTLPDGRNAHLIQQPKQWWLDKVVASDFHVVAAGDGVNSKNEVVGCWLECAPC